MCKQVIAILICLWSMCFMNSNAQTLIQIPFEQPPVLEVSAETVWIYFPEGGIEIGAEIIIGGGTGDYSYIWTSDNQFLGSEEVLFVEQMGNYYLQITDENDCSKSVRFVVSDATDVSEIKEEVVTVYPNPTHGVVYMQSSFCNQVTQITVVSAEGKLVRLYNQVPECTENILMIDLSGLPKGNYIISYLVGKELITKQVILL